MLITGESWLSIVFCTSRFIYLPIKAISPVGEYPGESQLPNDECTGESQLPGDEYTGEFRLLDGEHTGESITNTNNCSNIRKKSKSFLGCI